MGIYGAKYPVEHVPYAGNGIPREIYDTAVYTLECCMHEHYEDCPWREQAQYTMDSRTQMLCGYYAFGETEMAAGALRTMAHRLTAVSYTHLNEGQQQTERRKLRQSRVGRTERNTHRLFVKVVPDGKKRFFRAHPEKGNQACLIDENTADGNDQ